MNDTEDDLLDNETVDKELRRWQDGIRDKIISMGVPDDRIDGAGCDSGDPLDFTLAEVGQGIAYFVDQLEELRATTPPPTPSDAAMRAAEEVVKLTHSQDIDGGTKRITAEVAAIITRHLPTAPATQPELTMLNVRTVLNDSYKALSGLPKDCLGRDPEGWYYRDELITNIGKVLFSGAFDGAKIQGDNNDSV